MQRAAGDGAALRCRPCSSSFPQSFWQGSFAEKTCKPGAVLRSSHVPLYLSIRPCVSLYLSLTLSRVYRSSHRLLPSRFPFFPFSRSTSVNIIYVSMYRQTYMHKIQHTDRQADRDRQSERERDRESVKGRGLTTRGLLQTSYSFEAVKGTPMPAAQ